MVKESTKMGILRVLASVRVPSIDPGVQGSMKKGKSQCEENVNS